MQPQHVLLFLLKLFTTNNKTCSWKVFLALALPLSLVCIFMKTLMTKAKRLPSSASTYTECKWGRPPPYGTLVEDFADVGSSFFFPTGAQCCKHNTGERKRREKKKDRQRQRGGGGRTVLSASSFPAWHSLVWCWWLFVFLLSRVLHSVIYTQSGV